MLIFVRCFWEGNQCVLCKNNCNIIKVMIFQEWVDHENIIITLWKNKLNVYSFFFIYLMAKLHIISVYVSYIYTLNVKWQRPKVFQYIGDHWFISHLPIFFSRHTLFICVVVLTMLCSSFVLSLIYYNELKSFKKVV